MKTYILVSVLSIYMGWVCSLSAQTAADKAAEANWNAFKQALTSNGPMNAKACIGKRVLFQGGLMDSLSYPVHQLRPNPLRVGVARFDPAHGKFIGMRITCRVALRESEIKPVAGFVAGAVTVQVLGKITSFDSTTKTVEVQSETTEVIYSD